MRGGAEKWMEYGQSDAPHRGLDHQGLPQPLCALAFLSPAISPSPLRDHPFVPTMPLPGGPGLVAPQPPVTFKSIRGYTHIRFGCIIHSSFHSFSLLSFFSVCHVFNCGKYLQHTLYHFDSFKVTPQRHNTYLHCATITASFVCHSSRAHYNNVFPDVCQSLGIFLGNDVRSK